MQRKAAAAATGGPPPDVHSSREWLAHPMMDAAHRGTTPATLSGGASVQAKGGGSGQDTDAIHNAAVAGVSGAGGALPHAARIQESFGPNHDVSGIEAHVGGPAAEATQAMGASAYATGNKVAFQQAPDLHTAAHEAAHVIQQRQGVQLKGGVGQAGDSYERHADAVADAVVAGRPAVALLDQMAPGGAGSGAVQRKETGDSGAAASEGGKGAASRGIVQRETEDSSASAKGEMCLVDPQDEYESAKQILYSLGDDIDPTCIEFQNYCSAYEELMCSASAPDEPLALALPGDQVMAIDDTGQLLLLPFPEEYYQVDDRLVAALDEVAGLGLGGESISTLPTGELGQILLWNDGRAVSTPAMSAGFWELMSQGMPVETTDMGAITSPGFSCRPWESVHNAGLHGLFGTGIYQLGTYPLSRFQGVSLPAGSRIRFADPRFPIRAQTRVMSIFVPGTKKYYAWDLHSMPVGSKNPPIWHVNQKGMSSGLFGQSNHGVMTPTQIAQGRGLRYMKIGGRVFLLVGVAVDSWNLGASIGESIEEGTPAPALAEAVRVVGGWGGAWAGAKLGCAAGAVAGIETGPGMAATCIIGGFIGGAAGYFGADWIADLINED